MLDFQQHEIKDLTDERDKRPAAIIAACFKSDLRELELKLTSEINLLILIKDNGGHACFLDSV